VWRREELVILFKIWENSSVSDDVKTAVGPTQQRQNKTKSTTILIVINRINRNIRIYLVINSPFSGF
jgi:hypothetical protein